ncbi:MAG: hypothetical protein C5B57_07570 [Blastocatellia bacterium]|nr:MAG: hypothetical protein C5B57_07570 [Blastocatellia bacterium]
MRMMLQFSVPVEAGNQAARSGALGLPFQKILEALKPEAAYFTTSPAGERGGFIVFDMKDTSEIPAVAEPFFLALNAKVNFFPVMNAADLAKAATGIEKAVKEHGGVPAV